MAKKRKKRPLSLVSKGCAVGLICQTAFSPTVSAAATKSSLPAVGATEVPSLKTGGTLIGATVDASKSASGSLVINQNQSRAIIDWRTFNIGSAATVRFNQGTGTPGTSNWVADKSYAALNRIYDQRPSQIYGKLIADGQIFLINQNGILFGKDSQINVGALFASTMNIRNNDFLNGTLRFTAENYQSQSYQSPDSYEQYLADNPKATRAEYLTYLDKFYSANLTGNLGLAAPDSDAFISNQGNITTSTGGAVYLIGPNVVNSGKIITPTGVTALIAATRGTNTGNYDLLITDTRDTDVLAEKGVQSTLTLNKSIQWGNAVNTGTITAASGQVGMYGKLVEQNGVIRAVTAVKKAGRIELLATEKIVTGANSETSSPIDESGATANDTFFTDSNGKFVPKQGTITLAGLTTDSTTYAPPQQIEHHGKIEAHSGNVTLEASDKILLDSGSTIDVSGVWADLPATAVLINPQLNSINLRDDYGQKNGSLLGKYVWVDSRTGTTLADVSGYYSQVERAAMERNTTGGSIFLGSGSKGVKTDSFTTKQIVVKEGAKLDISGGGYNYAAGYIPTTQLISGNTIYDIATASQWLTYGKILTSYRYSPAFNQGSNAGSLTIEARQAALNGNLLAKVKRGSYQTRTAELTDSYGNQMTNGLVEPLGGVLTIGSSSKSDGASGWKDYVTERIVLTSDAPIGLDGTGTTYLSTDMLNSAGLGALYLNANLTVSVDRTAHLTMISLSDDSSASLFAVNARKIDVYGAIDLPGGTVALNSVNNVTSYDTNPAYSLTEHIFLADGSRISVAGDRIDNSYAAKRGNSQVDFGHTTGGKITLDAYSLGSDGLFIQNGALLDVSGGYSIASSGKISGGNAGTLTLAGPDLIIDGTVNGLALLGSTGGKIVLKSDKITIGATSFHLPDGFGSSTILDADQGLVLASDRFDLTGFGRIELDSFGDAVVEKGATLTPSLAVLAQPVPGQRSSSSAYVIADYDDVGSSSITIAAGAVRDDKDVTREYMDRFPGLVAANGYLVTEFPHTDYSAILSVAEGATIRTTPAGSIALSGPSATIDGTLTAWAGSISVAVKTNSSDTTYPGADKSGILTIGATAKLDASGYNKKIDGLINSLPAGYTALDAGSIALSADNSVGTESGNIVVNSGAKIDISGTDPEFSAYRQANGSRGTATVASAPGSLSLTFLNNLDLKGDLNAHSSSKVTGLKGGTLTISKTSLENGLPLRESDLKRYQDAGFDAFTFQSKKTINFTGDVTGGDVKIKTGRILTLDAPIIDGSGATSVTLEAPWVTLTNSYYPVDPKNEKKPDSGSTTLNVVSGGDNGYIDVTGSVWLSGFGAVSLKATDDIRLTDRYYSPGSLAAVPQSGLLALAGDLTLQAAAIYPTSQSVFTISAGGKITTLPGGYNNTGSIYSALGSLTLKAGSGIDHRGYLAAPLGQLKLDAGSGRLYLAKGSIATTSTDANVNIGTLDENGVWLTRDRSYPTLEAGKTISSSNAKTVTSAPESQITLIGNEVVSTDGATIDASGGGSISAYLFTPDLDGSVNPISVTGISGSSYARSNRFVILADNSVKIPGYTYTYVDTDGKTQKSMTLQAIHLQATTLSDGTVLKEGTYSILPESYAFLPGALIVSSLGAPLSSGTQMKSTGGYNVVAGYTTALGTSLQSSVMTAYTVRSASSVLKEGHFQSSKLIAGNGGSLTVSAIKSALIGGKILLAGLDGYKGASVFLNGSNVQIASSGNLFSGVDIGYDTRLEDLGLANKVTISADSLSNQGVEFLEIGTSKSVTTDTITVQKGVDLTAHNITLKADTSITLEENARLNAVSGSDGTLKLSSKTVILGKDAIAHAGGDLELRATTLDLTKILDDKGNDQLSGILKADNGELKIASASIGIAGDNVAKMTGGLYLTALLMDKLNIENKSIGFYSDTDLTFYGDVTLNVQKNLTIDAARVSGTGDVSLLAAGITLMNSGKDSQNYKDIGITAPSLDGDLTARSGKLTLNAGQITVSTGNSDDQSLYFDKSRSAIWNILLDNFSKVNLTSVGDLTFKGVGFLKTAAALDLTAARITTTYYSASKDANDKLTTYKSSRVTVDAETGKVTIGNSGGKAGLITTSGGSLEIKGGEIEDSGIIELPSGSVTLTAVNGVTLGAGAQILARGSMTRTQVTDGSSEYAYVYAPGGDVTINAGTEVKLLDGSLVDVSAMKQGDAGKIAISGPGGVNLIGGELKGTKGGGTGDLGGSFVLDTKTVNLVPDPSKPTWGFDQLIDKLNKGGFDEEISVRAREGDISSNHKVTARVISLSADGADGKGSITISGTLDASSATGGGRIELAAGKNLDIYGKLDASGTGASTSGGEVLLQAGGVDATGVLNVNSGTAIDVSGRDKDGKNINSGTVYFRTMRNAANNGLQMTLASGSTLKDNITGATRISVEGVKVYDPSTTSFSTMLTDAHTFMNYKDDKGSTISNVFFGQEPDSTYRLLPGIEIRNSGDFNLSSLTGGDLDLTTQHFKYNMPGVLTIRSTGDLNINANLLDHPTADSNTLRKNNVLPSWDYNLVAGADLNAANPLNVNNSKTGELVVGADKMVYTEDGRINFASAGNTTLYQAYKPDPNVLKSHIIFNDMFNSLGTFDGDVRGYVGGNLTLDGGVIQTATGDIDLTVGGNVTLTRSDITGYGSIRTTGEPAEKSLLMVTTSDGSAVPLLEDPRSEIWNYQNGGDITLKAGGSVSGAYQAVDGWDYTTALTLSQANGDSYDLNFAAWSARYNKSDIEGFDYYNLGPDSFTQGIATMAGGNVSIKSGADVASQVGTFGEGNLKVYARGDLYGRYLVSGTSSSEGNGSLMAMGSIGVSPASTSDYRQPVIELRYVNDFSATAFGGITLGTIMNPTLDGRISKWFPTYSQNGRVSLTSLGGDVSLLGSMYTKPSYSAPTTDGNVNLKSKMVLPSSLYVSSAGDFNINQDIILAPSSNGELQIYADGDIFGNSATSWSTVLMSDMNTSDFYASATTVPSFFLHGSSSNGTKALHADDKDPAVMVAGGNISNLMIYLPKQSTIAAGENLTNLFISTQNQTAGNLTSITAGGNIVFTVNPNSTEADSGIEHAGPGTLLVSAGGSIDLGNSNGIRTVGDSYNSYLSSDGSDLLVLAGVTAAMSASRADEMFLALRESGDKIIELKGAGETDEAAELLEKTREEWIRPLFKNAAQGSGSINMVSSKISTISDKADIYIIAGDKIDVGRSSLTTSTASTGIFTAKGGSINILSIGDVNVNQSRIMTYFSGDIEVWTDQGNINAGRGSKTSVNASPPSTVPILTNGVITGYKIVFTPPAFGSGIRAVTYDPNTTPGGTLATPKPGDVYVYTPQGTLDAGEAGISGGRVTALAQIFVNVQNISSSFGSVGVPASTSISVGGFTGNSNLTESSKLIDQTSGIGSARDALRSSPQAMDDFMSRFLDVKVISFDSELVDDGGVQDIVKKKNRKR